MENVIKRPLEKGGIDGNDRLHAGLGKSGSKGNRMALRYAHIEETLGEFL